MDMVGSFFIEKTFVNRFMNFDGCLGSWWQKAGKKRSIFLNMEGFFRLFKKTVGSVWIFSVGNIDAISVFGILFS